MLKIKNKKLIIIAILIFSILFYLSIGKIFITFTDIINFFDNKGELQKYYIVFSVRLPKIICIILIGAVLSVSASILQNITKNYLVDTSVIGINSGVGLSMISYIYFANIFNIIINPLILNAVTIIGAFLSCLFIYMFSYNKKENKVNIFNLIISGIIITTASNSAMLLISSKINRDLLNHIVNWQSGEILNPSWLNLLINLPLIIVPIIFLYNKHKIYDILQLGEEISISLGIDVKKQIIYTMIAIIISTSISILLYGNIMMLGILSANITRNIGFNKYKDIILYSSIIGIIILLISDSIGKIIIPSAEIPAGIMVSLLCAPYFLYTIIKNDKNN